MVQESKQSMSLKGKKNEKQVIRAIKWIQYIRETIVLELEWTNELKNQRNAVFVTSTDFER